MKDWYEMVTTRPDKLSSAEMVPGVIDDLRDSTPPFPQSVVEAYGGMFRRYTHPKNERYTRPEEIAFARDALGGIDLDPCADPERRVGAKVSWTIEDDGLSRSWVEAETVFINPPYSGDEIGAWVEHGIAQLRAAPKQSQLWLVPSSTTSSWSQALLAASYRRAMVYEQESRVHFLGPDYGPVLNPKTGKPSSPDFNTRWVLIWNEAAFGARDRFLAAIRRAEESGQKGVLMEVIGGRRVFSNEE